MTSRVTWISLTPVKATALQHVDEIELLESGLRGDRRFYLITERGRLVSDKDHGPLQLVRSHYDEDADLLSLTFADGEVLAGEVERGEEVETTFHRRPRPARLVHGPWAEGVSELMGQRVRLVEPDHGAADRGRSGAVTLLGVASLGALAGELGVAEVDGRRFRMNFGIDGLDAHAEDGWLGRRVRIGEAIVIPQGNVGRCVITTQNPDSGLTDLDTLKALAGYRRALETTEPLPFGVHAAVAEGGTVRVGDAVELV